MSDTATPIPAPDRYGRSPRGLTTRARVAIVVALAAAVALTAWFAIEQYRRSPAQADIVSFHVTDAEELSVDFQVSMPPGTTAVCTVQALASNFAQVGSLEVPVGPHESRTARYSVTVRTARLADSAVIEQCISG
jgi:hypothetical protein